MQVLSFVWRVQGHHFAGATQMLATGLSPEQSKRALEDMSKALAFNGSLPADGRQKLELPPDSFQWKEFRVATKNARSAVANALQVTMPEPFSLAHTVPPNQLRPAGVTGERLTMLPDERAIFGRGDKPVKFVYDYKAHTEVPDFYLNEDFWKLVFACDCGAEASCCQSASMLCCGFVIELTLFQQRTLPYIISPYLAPFRGGWSFST